MRTNNKILKIRHSNFPNIAFISGNGEYRTIDLKKHFKKLHLSDSDFGYEVLKDKELFKTVTVEDNALAWKQLNTTMKLPSGKTFTAFFHLDPLQTIQNSEPETPKANYQIGYKIKEERLSQNLSQDELAYKIGTSKHYISKVENAKTDFEFKTLQKIFDVGLGKKVHVSIYGREQALREVPNSVLKADFVQWLEQHAKSLAMIDGVDKKIIDILMAAKIVDTKAMSEMALPSLLKLLTPRGEDIGRYQFLDAWLVQARYLVNAEWSNLISLQRLLGGKPSKVERLARKTLKGDLFWG